MVDESLRLVFMGTPALAVPVLEALVANGHDVVGVYTQPDRRSGRGRSLTGPPVKQRAVEQGLSVYQPASLRDDLDACRQIADLRPDAIVVAAYGLFLPTAVLQTPRYGCLNVHPSLLPRYRGPSPVTSAIIEGDETTGVTVMLLDEGMDTGPILSQQETSIGNEETAEVLTKRLFELGTRLLIDTLPAWVAGEIVPTQQSADDATLTRRLEREDGRVDWSLSSVVLDRRVRGLTPWPGTFTSWRGQTLKILRVRASSATASGEPGTVSTTADGGVVVQTGSCPLELLEVQLEGRRRTSAAEFVQGQCDFIGAVLGTQ